MDHVSKRVVLMGLILFQAAGLSILLVIPGPEAYWMVFPYALLFGVAFGGLIPARALLLSEYFGTKHFGAIQGLNQSSAVLGGVIGPVLMGLSVDMTTSYRWAIAAMVVVSVLIAPAALLLSKARSYE